MKEQTNQTKPEATSKVNVRAICKYVILALLLIGTIVAYVFNGRIADTFQRTVSENNILQTLFQKVPAVIKSVQIVTIAVLIAIVVHFVLGKLFNHTNRAKTVVRLINSFLSWIIGLVAILLVLGAWGANPGTLLASAGILSLVIGLGAQSLIADIIAGLFIVIEGEYQIGDIVIIDDWRGTVQEIGIRTTKIVDMGGNVKIINNSDIRSIVNQTQELSLAKAYIGIEYGESIPRVEIVIRDNLDKIKERIPAIVEGPYYKGVNELGASSVDLLFVAKCKEEDIYQVQRDLNRELKLMFDENDINVPFPQIVLNQPPAFDKKTTKKMQAGAREFVEEQKELSKDIDENPN